MAGATGLQDRERYNDSNPHPALPLLKTQLRPVGFLARVIWRAQFLQALLLSHSAEGGQQRNAKPSEGRGAFTWGGAFIRDANA